MRLFCELFLAAVLIWLGWQQSFHDRIDQWRGVTKATTTQPSANARQTSAASGSSTTTTAPRQPFIPPSARVRPPPTPSGDWMWDPNRRGALDRPDPGYKRDVENASKLPYWIDGRGVRHYGNSPPPGTSPSQ